MSADGELWIGSSAGSPSVVKSTLTAGAGITITNGQGSITIALTDSDQTVQEFNTDTGPNVVPNAAGLINITGGTVAPKAFTIGSGNTIEIRPQATLNTFLYGQGTNLDMAEVGPLTDGQLIIGATAAAPAAANILSSDGSITITNGANSIDIIVNTTTSTIEHAWKASDFDALETNFAPISTDTGANAIESIRSFDDTTEEYVNFSFAVPTNVVAGTVTFRAYGYAATAIAARFVQMRFGHTALAASDTWDQTYTNVDSGDSAVDATQDDITIVEWTETIANLGWTAEDLVIARLSRIGTTGTNLVGDFQLISFSIEIPVEGTGAGSGGGVQSVSGTANRITSTGGTTPVIDIDAAYVGQASITTLGTVTTGTWNATAIGEVYGGTGQTTYSTGDILYASAPNTLSKLSIGSNGEVLTLVAGVPAWSTNAGVSWVEETGATRNLIVNQGVVGNRGTAQTFTLPATSAQFSRIRILRIGAGAVTIDWGTGQSIRIGNQVGTTTTGTIVSTAVGDAIELLCTVADTNWVAINGGQGNWTIT